jgi:hypothetical protein
MRPLQTRAPAPDSAVLDDLLPTASAARLLSRSSERLRQMARAGEIPSVITPLGRLFRRSDLEALLARRESSGATS